MNQPRPAQSNAHIFPTEESRRYRREAIKGLRQAQEDQIQKAHAKYMEERKKNALHT